MSNSPTVQVLTLARIPHLIPITNLKITQDLNSLKTCFPCSGPSTTMFFILFACLCSCSLIDSDRKNVSGLNEEMPDANIVGSIWSDWDYDKSAESNLTSTEDSTLSSQKDYTITLHSKPFTDALKHVSSLQDLSQSEYEGTISKNLKELLSDILTSGKEIDDIDFFTDLVCGNLDSSLYFGLYVLVFQLLGLESGLNFEAPGMYTEHFKSKSNVDHFHAVILALNLQKEQ